jgi:hypothetical protein
VKVRALFPIAAAAGLWMPATGFSQPAPLPVAATNPNQQLADAVAARIRGTDLATGADVSIVARDGTVQLTGSVRTAAHKDRLIAEVRAVAGVVLVRDAVAVQTPGVVQVQNPPLAAPVAPLPIGPVGGNPIVEPAPIGVPGQISPDLQAPPLPPYAWPTYAPHNNLSRVGYPEAYPYNAFPFIGPYYPFPKVPLGWRKVTLEWEDGHWYLGRNSAPHDYWRVRFW